MDDNVRRLKDHRSAQQDQRGSAAADKELARRVTAELARRPGLSAEVTVNKGIVRLSGMVCDRATADRIVDAARVAANSDNVRDELIVIGALAASALVLG